jgi:hypothetical protein
VKPTEKYVVSALSVAKELKITGKNLTLRPGSGKAPVRSQKSSYAVLEWSGEGLGRQASGVTHWQAKRGRSKCAVRWGLGTNVLGTCT